MEVFWNVCEIFNSFGTLICSFGCLVLICEMLNLKKKDYYKENARLKELLDLKERQIADLADIN